MKGPLLVAVLVVLLAGSAVAENLALVVGNSHYKNITPLRNPINDATAVADRLTRAGYQVDLELDADLDTLEAAIVRLGNALAARPEAVGFFYYAGHGVQASGENYLIPIEAKIASESFLRSKSVSVDALLDTLGHAHNTLNILVLDACRDNPFSWSRSAARGLMVVRAQPPGSMVVYSTSAGAVADDGTGSNGVFSAELIKNLEHASWTIDEIFRRTGQAVVDATHGKQVPAIYSQYFESVTLGGTPTAERFIDRFRFDIDSYEPRGPRIWSQQGNQWVEDIKGRKTNFAFFEHAQLYGLTGDVVERDDKQLKVFLPSPLQVGTLLYFTQDYASTQWYVLGRVNEVYR